MEHGHVDSKLFMIQIAQKHNRQKDKKSRQRTLCDDAISSRWSETAHTITVLQTNIELYESQSNNSAIIRH